MNHLIYINGLGPNYKGEMIYEFIFSETTEVWGDGWDIKPAFEQVSPPYLEFVSKVGVLSNPKVALDLVQKSDVFGMADAAEGVIALGWENECADNKTKLVFRFGEDEKEVKNKLYSRDIALEFEKDVKYEID